MTGTNYYYQIILYELEFLIKEPIELHFFIDTYKSKHFKYNVVGFGEMEIWFNFDEKENKLIANLLTNRLLFRTFICGGRYEIKKSFEKWNLLETKNWKIINLQDLMKRCDDMKDYYNSLLIKEL